MKLLLDTNVLIDYFARRSPYFESWLVLRVMQAFGDAELWTSSKSFTDVFYVLRKQVGSTELQHAFEESASFLRICSIDGNDILSASKARWPDFGDCLIYQAAMKVKADIIVSRDADGFERSKIPVLSPCDLREYMEVEMGTEYDLVELGI